MVTLHVHVLRVPSRTFQHLPAPSRTSTFSAYRNLSPVPPCYSRHASFSSVPKGVQMHVEDRPAKRLRISTVSLASTVVLLTGVVAIGWLRGRRFAFEPVGRVHGFRGAGGGSMDPSCPSTVPRQRRAAGHSGHLQHLPVRAYFIDCRGPA